MAYIGSLEVYEISDLYTLETDRVSRFDVPLSHKAVYDSVPVLKWRNWQILEIEQGYAVTKFPLNVESSNQYITQQAPLMLLAADYTGGIAFSTLLKKTPVIGFHPQRTDYGAYHWGAAATIKWLSLAAHDYQIILLHLHSPGRVTRQQWG